MAVRLLKTATSGAFEDLDSDVLVTQALAVMSRDDNTGRLSGHRPEFALERRSRRSGEGSARCPARIGK